VTLTFLELLEKSVKCYEHGGKNSQMLCRPLMLVFMELGFAWHGGTHKGVLNLYFFALFYL
jgi:hypothetical protein